MLVSCSLYSKIEPTRNLARNSNLYTEGTSKSARFLYANRPSVNTGKGVGGIIPLARGGGDSKI
jgi:hypothetical protein